MPAGSRASCEQRGQQHDPGEHAEPKLLVKRGEVISRQQEGEVRHARADPDRGASGRRRSRLRPAARCGLQRDAEKEGLRRNHGFTPELQLVPRGDRGELEQRPAPAGMLVGELGLLLLPDHLERAALDLMIEPGAAEDQLAQPVDERLALDQRDALPVAREVAAEARLRPVDQALRGKCDEVARLLVVELVHLDEPELRPLPRRRAARSRRR